MLAAKNWFHSPENKIQIVLWGLIFLVVFLPLCFGGNRPLPAAFMACLSSALLFIWARAISQKRELSKVSLRHVWFIALPFAAVMLWALLQATLPLGGGFIHPIWKMASNALDTDIPSSISLNVHASLFGIMKFCSYGIVFWLALQVGRSQENAHKILLAIAVAGGAYGLYGLFMHFSGIEKVLWYDKKGYIGNLSSTFINRNSYATYAGIGLISTLAFLTSTVFENTSSLRGKHYYYALIENLTKKSIWFFTLVIIIVPALIMTDSRAGFVSALIGVMSLLALLAISSSDKKKKFLILSCGALVIILFSLIMVSNGSDLFRRLSIVNDEMGMRADIYKVTLNAIKDAPILGYGLGTFEDVFSMYRDTKLTTTYITRIIHTHNTYLEVMLELGIVSFTLLATAILSIIFICFKGIFERKRGKIFPIVAIASSVLIWVHALVDFSIEMPAIAVTYAAILGVGVAQSKSTRESMSDRIRNVK